MFCYTLFCTSPRGLVIKLLVVRPYQSREIQVFEGHHCRRGMLLVVPLCTADICCVDRFPRWGLGQSLRDRCILSLQAHHWCRLASPREKYGKIVMACLYNSAYKLFGQFDERVREYFTIKIRKRLVLN